MALSSAFYTALSGLDINAQNMDVIGNNIANVNTTAYKSTRAVFTEMFARSLSFGSQPSTDSGGTNPTQVGLGTRFDGIQKNLTNGSIQTTGLATNLALEGNGMFVVEQNNQRFFTRSGAFTLNQDNQLVDLSGGYVQGYGVDESFNIVPSALVDLTIPLGTLTIAKETRNVNFSGNLNASGPLSTGGAVHETRAFFTTDTLTVGTEEDGTTDLTVAGNDLYIDNGAGGSFLAIEGGTDTVITLAGVEKSGKDLGAHTFGFSTQTADALGVDEVGTTLSDFVTFLDKVLGLDSTSVNGHDLGGSIAINAAGQIVITGNEGTVQDLTIETADLVAVQQTDDGDADVAISQPFVMTKTGSADGESVRTSFVVYDSLGTPLTAELSFVLQDVTPGSGTTWEWIAESVDNDDVDQALGVGLVTFDQNGNFVDATNQSFSLTRDNGAVTPLTVNMNFSSDNDAIFALSDTLSSLAAVSQDGSPIGTLDEFSIGEDGIINGSFTNGLVRVLGQVALSTFSNPQGLLDEGNGRYVPGPNSGDAIIAAPGQFGSARIFAGALELSNVDLASEFVNLINASTGFSANSRVVTTTDQMIQELLSLVR